MGNAGREAAKRLAIANARPADETAEQALYKMLDDSLIKEKDGEYTGITEQLIAIGEKSAYFFETVQKPKAGGVNPPTSDDDQPTKWQNDYNSAKKSGDTKTAIRVKQEAFENGVILN